MQKTKKKQVLKADLIKEVEIKRQTIELLDEELTTVKIANTRLQDKVNKLKDFLTDESKVLVLHKGQKLINTILFEGNKEEYIITIEKRGCEGRGYGRTLQSAYNMACVLKYDYKNEELTNLLEG